MPMLGWLQMQAKNKTQKPHPHHTYTRTEYMKINEIQQSTASSFLIVISEASLRSDRDRIYRVKNMILTNFMNTHLTVKSSLCLLPKKHKHSFRLQTVHDYATNLQKPYGPSFHSQNSEFTTSPFAQHPVLMSSASS